MLTTPQKMMFLMTLTLGTLLSISSTLWYGAWMGLKTNVMYYILLISTPNNQRNTEASIKLNSSAILTAALIMINSMNFNMQTQLLTMALLTLKRANIYDMFKKIN